MKCEDFLAALESNSAWQRCRAARHAAGCPDCSAAASMANDLRREMSCVEPLPAALREVWATSAGDVAVRKTSQLYPRQWMLPGLAAAALLVAAIGLAFWANSRPERLSPRQIADISGITDANRIADLPAIQFVDASAQFSELLGRVETLQREIESTVKQAELLDARKQADRMIAIYSRW